MFKIFKIFSTCILVSGLLLSDECSSFEVGDINNDDNLNIIDIIAFVDIVLNNNFISTADLNHDEIVSVADIIALVEIVLNPLVMDINIDTIDFNFVSLYIEWNRTQNSRFSSYNIYYSNYIDNTSYLIASIDNIEDTSLSLDNIVLNEQNYFYISLKDLTGCELISTNTIFELPYKMYELNNLGNIENTEFSTSDFKPSSECAACHTEHYEEWFSSMHSYTSRSPLFFNYKTIVSEDHPQVGERFCMQCHNPVAYLTGNDTSEYNNVDLFQNSNLDQSIKDGIGCDVCHTITGLSNTVFTSENLAANAEYKMYPLGNIKFGSIQNPEPNNFHASYYLPTYTSSQMCLPCHDLVIDGKEAEITFTEWNRIPGFSMFGGVSCQECHMPLKENGYHSHKFVGVDIDLSIPLNENSMKDDVQGLLETSASLEFIYQGQEITNLINNDEILTIPITVTSHTGHSLPSGTSFSRQVWLELVVENGNNIIYESGRVDSNEQLNFEDSDLLLFRSEIYGDDGNLSNKVTDIGTFVNYSLLAYSSREKKYELDILNNLEGTLDISARLLFRPFDPNFILEHHPEFIDNLPVYVIDSINTQIEIQ